MEVKLDRQYYTLQDDMISWCQTNIGPGGWKNSPVLLFPNQDKWVWTVDSVFGYTTFTFTTAAAARRFTQEWL